ncbi:hypothetical protein L2E82_01603 [Cichorium intybus]|uniref:Uncharacterized protein n=1 Tax=Cichorium intybus TaxID=13427 RepID=A0ACB9H0W9_CICIN|nr:hypothetical protein L2E82_01603 [Cichorium intybus]
MLKPELNKAIHGSAISLIVFSNGYATSKWCLDEVMMIIREHETSSSKHEVVPVFYKVDPSDVRNQRGSFKEAFDVYDDEIKAETDLEKKTELLVKLGEWRNSLRKAASLTGMVLVDGYESEFIMDVVNVIRRKLDYKALYIEEKLVGIKDDVAEIESWLQDPSPNALAANPDPEIQEVLEISYKTLKYDTDKELFLHIACFFMCEKEDYIVKLLAQCDLYPVVGIKNLIDRCLVYVEVGRVWMHQLIKEMGREVVRKESPKDPGKRSRLWRHQDCIDVLQNQSGTEKVEGLMLVMPKMKEAQSTHSFKQYSGKRKHGNNANFEIGALENMKNLMLLQLNYVTFSGKCKKLPRKLRLLRWHGCTLKTIPSESCLEKLVVLDMSHSKLKRVWDDFKFIGSLKILNLSYSVELIKTPDFCGLPCLPESLGYLNANYNESLEKTKDLLWRYYQEEQRFPKNAENYAWLSAWRCGNLLEAGDEISIHILNYAIGFTAVEECRINVLYGVDEQLDEETKEACDVSAFDEISWTDRMHTNISDYVCSGGMYGFINSYRDPLDIERP